MKEVIQWLDREDEGLLRNRQLCDKARLLLLDTIICIVSGSKSREVQRLVRTLSGLSPGSIRFPGSSASLGTLESVFAATLAACWDEACEGLARAHGRPGLHAIPVAVILGVQEKLSLGQVLRAIIWGYEAGGRAGEAMRVRPGFHVDGSWGAIAASVAASRALGLDSNETLTALNIASGQTPTGIFLPVIEGHTSRNTYAAQGSQHGIWSAVAAKSGITAPQAAFRTSLELNFRELEKLPDELVRPSRFYLMDAYLKPFAGARHLHYPTGCAIQYRDQYGVPALSEIQSLRLYLYPEAIRYCGNRDPQSALQAQFSLTWATSYSLLFGQLDPGAYSAQSLANPMVRQLESRIEIRESNLIRGRGCTLELSTPQGKNTVTVDQVAGDPDQPLTSADIVSKAFIYLDGVLPSGKIERLTEDVLEGDLEQEFALPW